MCGELRPILDTTARNATSEELQEAMNAFSAGLAKSWKVGSCDNTVTVVYWQAEEMVRRSLICILYIITFYIHVCP